MIMFDDNTMMTVSGRMISFRNPDPTQIVLSDIAHALARAPRWAGHTSTQWTVADHSILVAELYLHETNAPTQEVFRGLLLHDATEAYLADIPSPAKRMLPDYRKIEEKLYYRIYEALKCPTPYCEIKKIWDRTALLLEARDLFEVVRDPRQFGIDQWPSFPGVFFYVNQIKPWPSRSPTTRSEVFCRAYAEGYHDKTTTLSAQARVCRQERTHGVGTDFRPSCGGSGQFDPRDPACGAAQTQRTPGQEDSGFIK